MKKEDGNAEGNEVAGGGGDGRGKWRGETVEGDSNEGRRRETAEEREGGNGGPLFLTRRIQEVLVNGGKSKSAPVTCGIPQGSVRLLFAIYINLNVPRGSFFFGSTRLCVVEISYITMV